MIYGYTRVSSKSQFTLNLLDNNSYNKVAEITGISKSTLIRESRCRKAITLDY